GVRRTTVAAATAIRLARANRDARVLVLSTDPAHSLGDVFGVALSDAPTAVAAAPRNLLARELDAPAALAARRTGLEAALEEITRTFGVVAMEGGRGVRELLDLAPPGIDELFGILSIVEEIGISGVSRRSGAPPTIVVVDTAPTGHALRLLEMPAAALEWVQTLMRVLLKYRALVRPAGLASELVALSKSIRQLQELLRDGRESRFIV